MVKKLNCSLHLFNDAEAISSFATEFHHLWTPTVLTHCSDNGNRTRTLTFLVSVLKPFYHAIRVFSRASRIRTCDLVLPKHPLYQLSYSPKYRLSYSP